MPRPPDLGIITPSDCMWAVSAIHEDHEGLWHFLNIVNAGDEEQAIKAGRILVRQSRKLGAIKSVRALPLDHPSANPREERVR